MANCPICKDKILFMEGKKTTDGSVCFQCAEIVPDSKLVSTKKLKELWDKNRVRWDSFTETRILHSEKCMNISVDDDHRFFVIGKKAALRHECVVYSFDEVESYEFETIEGETVTHKKGGLTRAIVGGLIAGPAGALVGSVTAQSVSEKKPDLSKLKVYLTTEGGRIVLSCAPSNPQFPQGFTDFLDNCIAGDTVKSASSPATNNISIADEILKFKALKDEGIITEDEFQAKKASLLSQ